MSKKIQITLEVEVQNDDYEDKFKKLVQNNDLDFFAEFICDLVHDEIEFLVVTVK